MFFSIKDVKQLRRSRQNISIVNVNNPLSYQSMLTLPSVCGLNGSLDFQWMLFTDTDIRILRIKNN